MYIVSIDDKILKHSYLSEISFKVHYLHTLYGLDIKDSKARESIDP